MATSFLFLRTMNMHTVEAATKQAQMPNAPLKPRAVPDTAATSGTPMASQMGLPKNTMP